MTKIDEPQRPICADFHSFTLYASQSHITFDFAKLKIIYVRAYSSEISTIGTETSSMLVKINSASSR